MQLNHTELLEVIKKTPLVAIDLIVINNRNQVLLGLRKNAPAKDFWFVPGGRILKNESIADAFKRITKIELGTPLKYKDATFLGVFEHLYDENFAHKAGIGTHYIVLAHQINIDSTKLSLPKDQHSQFKWFDTTSLHKYQNVHPNTKAYFQHPSKSTI